MLLFILVSLRISGFFDAHFYRRIRITSHTIPISSRTAANAVESPNRTAPSVSDRRKPARLNRAPSSVPQTRRARPTHLKISTKNTTANSIDIIAISPPVRFCYKIPWIISVFFRNVNVQFNHCAKLRFCAIIGAVFRIHVLFFERFSAWFLNCIYNLHIYLTLFPCFRACHSALFDLILHYTMLCIAYMCIE